MTIQQRVLTRLLTIFFTIPVFAIYIQAVQPAMPIYAHDNGPSAHEGDEGLILAPARAESVYPAAHCPADAPVRAYNVVAIQVAITLNRYLDYDPEGRMYVLAEELGQARQEEAQNAAARKAGSAPEPVEGAEPAVSLGLQGDAIQPLVLRVNQGECLQITLRNDLPAPEAVTLHLHGSGLYVQSSGTPALADNAEAIIAPGATITYAWWVSLEEPEGTHYFHSHADERFQTGHGLFGAVIVEPHGARYHDPRTGQALLSGWDAIIAPPAGDAFREFVIIYHEIGNERYRHADRNGRLVTQVDPYTGAYRPGDRAINYRSEPFMNRLQLQQERFGRFDESLVYSSYAFGDPATPIARSYLGDPVKQRLVHGGAEVFHVHHVHGGAIRWPRQPGLAPTNFAAGLVKHPPLLPQVSERTDAQSVGPAESFDIANECGSGGCQQSVGDYLFHCHVAHHYFAGMWGLWRVYNTLQDGPAAQDSLPPLLELPDRAGQTKTAVTAEQLIGRTVDWHGLTFTITQTNLAAWVERQLPPAGVPQGYDAAVWNWQRRGNSYFGEPATTHQWPGYQPSHPFTQTGDIAEIRPPLYFDPQTGKLAYPFLRPHLGQRPPFAPNHGPAPFLEPIQQGTGPPAPGANGPGSLCPAGTRLQQFVIHAINLPIPLNAAQDLIDPSGAIFVLKPEEAAVRATDNLKTPLALRANAGEDCIDVIFKSELVDNRENKFFSKVSLHIHFVQFDIQASDGVDAGFNYEQTLRPFTVEGETIQTPVAAGATALALSSTARFQPGVLVGVGMDQDETFEIRRVLRVEPTRLFFDEPLQHAHATGEIVSTEFLRQRWYPDVQFGTAYFHDHVNALSSWRHGLYGALIAEPPGSTYHHPHTGEPLISGPIADIHTDAPLAVDVTGSFRELVLFLQDDNPLTHVGDSSGSSFNLRVEPLTTRLATGPPDPARLFSSQQHGDPVTPLLEAYLGDPLAIRGLVAAANDVHTLHVDGHWFRVEPFSPTSPPVNTVHLGISERYDLVIPRAGGPQQMAGDYLYYNGRAFKLREGSWGLLRVYDQAAKTTLQPLPGHTVVPVAAKTVCPADAPRKVFAVVASETPLPMLGQETGKIYRLRADKETQTSGSTAPSTSSGAVEPLVLHVNVGDCIIVHLTNDTKDGPVSFHADMLAGDPQSALGVEAGFNPPQAVPVGQSGVYTYFAHPEVGETVALVRDWGNVLENPRLGLYGAIIVGPPGATYRDPVTGADLNGKASWQVAVYPSNAPPYRDFTLFLQDEDPVIGTHIMPYSEQVRGVVGLNYGVCLPEGQGDKVTRRQGDETVTPSPLHLVTLSPCLNMAAFAGDPLRVHVLVPFSEQAHVFTLAGHRWLQEPQPGANLLSAVQVGALEAIAIVPIGGANAPGVYRFGDQRAPYREAGLWGLFQVYAPGTVQHTLQPLTVK
ncbi:MAG: hypothetical protein DYG89_40120 [Caldilinea sp. CFX5]|nr:hypothetical protein [Caldilinea sp. CFX5]